MKPLVAITVGDPNGIGPEIALKALAHSVVRKQCVPLLIGPEEVFEFYAQRARMNMTFQRCEYHELHRIGSKVKPQKFVHILRPSSSKAFEPKPGLVSVASGRVAGEAIECATRLALSNAVSAIVTSPVSKIALQRAGFNYTGQTEFLRSLTDSETAVMMLVSNSMRVALATIHVPLKRVSQFVTIKGLTKTLKSMCESLQNDWRIRNPRIAVLGLNPHAGESGAIGNEELDCIRPALGRARRIGLDVDGPFPADAFFGRMTVSRYHAILAMYHDQGLIPLKMDAQGTAVNVTIGLPIIRTSPDHGTAFDIAGTNKANPESMICAILLGISIARNRKSQNNRSIR